MFGVPHRHFIVQHATGASSADSSLVLTLNAVADEYHILDSVHAAYDATPTVGRLKVKIGGVFVFDVPITVSGDREFIWPNGLYNSVTNGMGTREGKVNETLKVILIAGGSGVIGSLNITFR